MILQWIILWIVIIVSPLVPPILVPLSYSMTAALLLQWIDPRILSIISVGAALIADIIIWKMQNFIIEKINKKEEAIIWTHIIARIINKMNSYFKKEEKIGRLSIKREKYLEKKTWRVLTFFFAIFCYLPILPDIIWTRILYKKIKFIPFIIAVIIGKSVTHIPFIFLGKWLIEILQWRI
jgi:hypothetical protein